MEPLAAARLSQLFRDDIRLWTLPSDDLRLSEPEFTGKVLMPRVLNFVRGLRRKSLVVNGDGYTSPSAVTYARMNFYPDIEILEFGDRILAVEVKVLRESDPSGALSKSFGQALVYRSLGFSHSHVIILDSRADATSAWGGRTVQRLTMPDGIGLTAFAQKASKLLECLFQSSEADTSSSTPDSSDTEKKVDG